MKLKDYVQHVLNVTPIGDVQFDLLIEVDKQGEVFVTRATGASNVSRIRFTTRAFTESDRARSK